MVRISDYETFLAIELQLLLISLVLAERIHTVRHQPCRTSGFPPPGGRHEAPSKPTRHRPPSPLPLYVQNAEVLEKPQTRVSMSELGARATELDD